MPSDLRASVVTQPGALVLSPLVALSGSDKPLGMQDGNSFGLNLKASWEDSLTSFISIKMHFLSCSWCDLPLQPSWRGGCTSYDVFTLLKCHSWRLSLNITRMLITGKLGTSGLKSLLSFPFSSFQVMFRLPCNYWHLRYSAQTRFVAQYIYNTLRQEKFWLKAGKSYPHCKASWLVSSSTGGNPFFP